MKTDSNWHQAETDCWSITTATIPTTDPWGRVIRAAPIWEMVQDQCERFLRAIVVKPGDALPSMMATLLVFIEPEANPPDWCCSECGSMGPFRDICRPSTPDSAEEHDIQCEACGSGDVDESPRCVIQKYRERIEELEQQLSDRNAHESEQP